MRALKFLTLLSSVIISLITHAALPPLSQEDREAYASTIMTGVVVNMNMVAQKTGYRSVNNIYTVIFAPTNIEKGDMISRSVEFTFWKAAERPDGWCGPTGQYGMMKVGDNIRVYMYKNEENTYQLIEPNGFDKL